MSSIPGLERSPGGGNGKYSSLLPGKSMDRGAGEPRPTGLQRVNHD